MANPDPELHDQRAVEAQAGADRRDVLRGRGVAGEDRRRVPRREPEEEEDEDGDDQEDRQGPQQPSREELGQF